MGQHKRRNRLFGQGLEVLEDKKLLAADLVSAEAGDNSLVLNFSTDIAAGPGTAAIVLSDSDGVMLDMVPVNSDRVDIDGSTVTVTPNAEIPSGATVSVHIDQGAFVDGDTAGPAEFFTEDFESVELENSLLVPSFNDYVAVFSGTLNVTTAGEYTFGVNSDDGQTLAIDLGQDGVDLIDDEIIYDNNNHGRQDRLSTCAFDAALQSCEGTGDEAISMDVGEYEFIYMYYERGGGSGGEFFYAPGTHEIWDAEAFALVGDDSKGIGLVDGVTVTVYKEAEGVEIASLPDAEGVIDDDSLVIGEEKLDLADIAEDPGGRFDLDNAIPGAEAWAIENDPNPFDFSQTGPRGWINDNSDLIEGGAPEYNGWTYLDKEFWIAQQGDQNRTNYELASGTVLVADPDAHDDFIDNGGQDSAACLDVFEFGAECGLFTASASTPHLYLTGVAENSATLEFASSWWDEDTQSAELRVEYFDTSGASISDNVLLRWESISDSPNYKPVMDADGNDARNELITLDLANPSDAASMVVTFDMPYATNDWWWAVDNVKVSGEVTGELFAGVMDDSVTVEWTGGSTGGGGVTGADVTQPGDEIVRVDGENDGDGNDGPPPGAETVENVINDVTQKYLNFLDIGSGFVVTPSVGPTVVTGLRLYTANDAVERDPASYVLEGGSADGSFTLISEGDLDLPEERNAGGDIAIDDTLVFQELSFANDEAYDSYRLTFPTLRDADAANSMQIAEVEFVGTASDAGSNDPTAVGDFDSSGMVDFLDFLTLANNFGQPGSGANGDADGSGTVDFLDFLTLANNFGKSVDEIFAA